MEQQIIHALGWAVLHSLWQGIAVGILAAIALFLMPRKWATVRYFVALGSMIFIFLMACTTFFWELSSKAIANENLDKIILNKYNFDEKLLSDYNNTLTVVTLANEPLSIWQKIQFFCEAYLHWVAALWLIGVAVLSIRLVGGWLWLRRLRLAVTPLSKEWQNRLEHLKKQLNVKQKIQLVESGLVQVPTLIGWLKPMILLPVGIVTSLAPDEIEMILLHELSHIRAKDYLVNIVQSIIEILFYYHPIVWWLSETARTEREHRADDSAVKVAGNAVFYVKTLLKAQTFRNELDKTPKLSLALLGKKPVLLNRVKRILNISSVKHNNLIMERFSATAILLLGLVGVGFSSSYQSNNNSFATPPSVTSDSTAPRRVEKIIERRIENRSVIKLNKDGKDLKAEFSNNEMKRLEVDGKEIPQSDWGKYEAALQEMREKMPPPPPLPPMPPLPPDAPNPDGDLRELSNMSHLELLSDKDANGNTVLKLKKGDGTTTEVIVTKDGIVKIDGKTYKTGDRIRLESDSGRRQMIFFNNDEHREIIFLNDSNKKEMRREIRIEMEHAERERERGEKEQRRAEREMQRAQRELERAQREVERAQQRLEREQQMTVTLDEKFNKKIAEKLRKDGFLKAGEKKYSLNLTDKELIINGKKQSAEKHKEYLDLYKTNGQIKDCKGCTFSIQMEDDGK